MAYNSITAGNRIRQIRRERGLSQEVVSGCAGISRSHLAAIEAGTVIPTVSTLWQICDALNVRPSALLCYLEEEELNKTRT